jgi:hypothetical protein
MGFGEGVVVLFDFAGIEGDIVDLDCTHNAPMKG